MKWVVVVVDSDFYDFNKERVQRSFRKGQVWVVYSDDDGMPRHYAFIDETVSHKCGFTFLRLFGLDFKCHEFVLDLFNF